MEKLNICVDMYGCPNRCRHCWLGHPKNTAMAEDADERIVNYFKPYFEKIAFYSWFREPDHTADYEARWERDKSLSVNTLPQRFELASFYRLCRDSAYVKFLKRVGTEKVQLTLFGMEEMTDRYVGRKGAFREIITAAGILMDNGIAPRYQIFINEENKDEIKPLIHDLQALHENKDCKGKGIPFNLFIHEGSCDGENKKLYGIRIKKQDIPAELIPYYLGYDALRSEKECCELLKNDPSHHVYHNTDEMTLYITADHGVYYNFENVSENWRAGNLLHEPPESLVPRLIREDTFALNEARKITVGELVERYGDPTSERAFSPEDYKGYLLNCHIESLSR